MNEDGYKKQYESFCDDLFQREPMVNFKGGSLDDIIKDLDEIPNNLKNIVDKANRQKENIINMAKSNPEIDTHKLDIALVEVFKTVLKRHTK